MLAAAGAYAVVVLNRPTVEVAQATRGPAVQAVYATGVVEPLTWAKVTPNVQAQIVDLCACEGQHVARDAELARLDDAEARAELAELEAREKFLSGETERYRNLLDRGVVSTQSYERTVSELLQVRAAIRAQDERLDRYVLRAPIEGQVLRRDGEIGEIVAPGQVVFWVGRPRPLRIVAEVDEEDIPLVAPDQPVLIDADAFPDRALAGTVAQITPKGDPVNKSYRVRIALPDDTPLLIGMTVAVNIVAREFADAVLVPAGALDGDSLFTLRDGRAVRRAVTVGIRGGERVQILDGIAEGESVIVGPPEGLRDGDRVDPASADGT